MKVLPPSHCVLVSVHVFPQTTVPKGAFTPLTWRFTISQLLVFTYPPSKTSFTGYLSTELSYLHPDKIIIIGREKGDEIRMSLRSRDIAIEPILKKALVGLDGYGGGHSHACGANIKMSDLNLFIERIRNGVKKVS